MLSQQELADRAGVSLFTVQRIERGEGSVRPKTGRAIAAALGVPIEELLPKAPRRSLFEPSFNDVLAEGRPPVEISAAAGAAGGAAADVLAGVDEHFGAIVQDLRAAGLGEEVEREALARLEETREEIRRLVGTG